VAGAHHNRREALLSQPVTSIVGTFVATTPLLERYQLSDARDEKSPLNKGNGWWRVWDSNSQPVFRHLIPSKAAKAEFTGTNPHSGDYTAPAAAVERENDSLMIRLDAVPTSTDNSSESGLNAPITGRRTARITASGRLPSAGHVAEGAGRSVNTNRRG